MVVLAEPYVNYRDVIAVLAHLGELSHCLLLGVFVSEGRVQLGHFRLALSLAFELLALLHLLLASRSQLVCLAALRVADQLTLFLLLRHKQPLESSSTTNTCSSNYNYMNLFRCERHLIARDVRLHFLLLDHRFVGDDFHVWQRL